MIVWKYNCLKVRSPNPRTVGLLKSHEVLDLDDVLQIKDLSYEKWKLKVLSQVDDALVTACLLFIEQMRSNVTLSIEEKNHVKFAIQSFTEVIYFTLPFRLRALVYYEANSRFVITDEEIL